MQSIAEEVKSTLSRRNAVELRVESLLELSNQEIVSHDFAKCQGASVKWVIFLLDHGHCGEMMEMM
jgi:hypothetical protein